MYLHIPQIMIRYYQGIYIHAIYFGFCDFRFLDAGSRSWTLTPCLCRMGGDGNGK